MFATKSDIKLFVRGELVPKQDYVSVEIPPPSTYFTTEGEVKVTYTNGTVTYYRPSEVEVIVKYSEENVNVKD